MFQPMGVNKELKTAVEAGSKGLKAIRSALERGADVNASPLMEIAVHLRKLDIAEILLEAGADLESKNEEEETPLMSLLHSNSGVMSRTEETHALWLLDKGADVHTTDDFGQGTLHLAAGNGSKTLVRALVKRGAKVGKDEVGGTPLHLCISTNDRDTEMWGMLIKLGCDLEDRSEGDTVLLTAQMNWNAFAVKYFIEKGADVDAVDKEGKTALDRARDLKQKKLIPILEKTHKPAAKKTSATAKKKTSTSAKKKKAAKSKGKAGVTRLEFSDGSSNKFWQISVSGAEHSVCYGRIGTDGQTKTKSFASAELAAAAADTLLAQKRKKGYS